MIGLIYKISNADESIVYVGSTTCTLSRRKSFHMNDYRKWSNQDKRFNCSIFKYFARFGIDNFSFTELKSYEVCDKKHLRALEQLWINKTKSVNQYHSFGGIGKVAQKKPRAV